MELRDLEYFAIVAEHGHFGRAAEALGLSQPALSMGLRRIETSMQTKLVKRTPKGVELTVAGADALVTRTASSIVARRCCARSRGPQSGTCRAPAHRRCARGRRTAAGTRVRCFVEIFTQSDIQDHHRGEGCLIADVAKTENSISSSAACSAPARGPRSRVFVRRRVRRVCIHKSPVGAAREHLTRGHCTGAAGDVSRERTRMATAPTRIRRKRTRPPEGCIGDRLLVNQTACSREFPSAGLQLPKSLRRSGRTLQSGRLAVNGVNLIRPLGVIYRKGGYSSPAAVRRIDTLKSTTPRMAPNT